MSKHSSNTCVLVVALFIFSFESNAMLTRIIPKSCLNYSSRKITRHLCTKHFNQTSLKLAYPFQEGLTDEPTNLINEDIRNTIKNPQDSEYLYDAFIWASMHENFVLMHEIVDAGFNINKHSDSAKPTLLEEYLDKGNLQFAKRLMTEFNASPNIYSLALSNKGDQPLWLKYVDNTTALKLLIEHGLDTTQTDSMGGSLLTHILLHAANNTKDAKEYIEVIDVFYINNCKIHDSDRDLILVSYDFVEKNGWANLLEEAGKTAWEPNEKEEIEKIFHNRRNMRNLLKRNDQQQQKE